MGGPRPIGNFRNFRTRYGNRRPRDDGTGAGASEILRTILEEIRVLQAVPVQQRLQPCSDFCCLTLGVHRNYSFRGFGSFRTRVRQPVLMRIKVGAAGITKHRGGG
jgi:hypothetical protein